MIKKHFLFVCLLNIFYMGSSNCASSSNSTISTTSSDSGTFPLHVVQQSPVLEVFAHRLPEPQATLGTIQIPNVSDTSAQILSQLMQKMHVDTTTAHTRPKSILIKKLRKGPLKECTQDQLCELVRAINYLDITNEVGAAIAQCAYRNNIFENKALETQPILFAMQLAQSCSTYVADKKTNRNDLMYPLHYACKMHRLDLVEHFINTSRKDVMFFSFINTQNSDGYSPLAIALENNDESLARTLVLAGANVNISLPNGQTPLTQAIHNERPDIVHMLLKNNACPNMQNLEKQSPLELALRQRNHSLMNALVSAGVNVHSNFSDGQYPVYFAFKNNDKKAIKILFAAGAYGKITISTKIVSSNRFLSSHEKNSYEKHELFEEVLKTEDLELIQMFIDAGADINATCKRDSFYYHKTPLAYALYIERDDIAEMLIQAGANPNIYQYSHDSPLQHAIENDSKHIVKQLLSAGATLEEDILATSNFKFDIEITQMLLDAGANPNAELGYRGSILIETARMEDPRRLNMLLDAGADVNATTWEGETALAIAARLGHEEAAKLLIQHNANVNAQIKSGMTALMHASASGHTNIMHLLLNCNADIHATTNNGINALMRAAATGQSEAIHILINAGADVNAKAHDSSTALMAAASNGHLDITTLLLHEGANANDITETGRTAFMMARSAHQTDIMDALLQAGAIDIPEEELSDNDEPALDTPSSTEEPRFTLPEHLYSMFATMAGMVSALAVIYCSIKCAPFVKRAFLNIASPPNESLLPSTMQTISQT